MAPVILFVHGCGGSNLDWIENGWGISSSVRTLAQIPDGQDRQLQIQYSENHLSSGQVLSPHTFMYFLGYANSDSAIPDLATGLGRAIMRIKEDPPDGRSSTTEFVLVTHSLGSVVARCYIQGMAMEQPFRGDIVGLYMIAPPNRGCLLVNRATSPVVPVLSCQQATSIGRGGQLIRQLNNLPLPSGIAYRVAAGVGCGFFPGLGYHDGLITLYETDLLNENTKVPGLTVTVPARHGNHGIYPCFRGGPPILGYDNMKRNIVDWYHNTWP